MSFARQVSGIVVADSEGEFLASKFYGPSDVSKFIKELSKKLAKVKDTDIAPKDAHISLVDKYIVQVKQSGDILLVVVFEPSENDILLLGFADALWKCMQSIAGTVVTKKKVLDKLDQVFVLIDESCEDGIILDDDSDSLMGKIDMRSDHAESPPPSAGGIDGLRSVFASARSYFNR